MKKFIPIFSIFFIFFFFKPLTVSADDTIDISGYTVNQRLDTYFGGNYMFDEIGATGLKTYFEMFKDDGGCVCIYTGYRPSGASVVSNNLMYVHLDDPDGILSIILKSTSSTTEQIRFSCSCSGYVTVGCMISNPDDEEHGFIGFKSTLKAKYFSAGDSFTFIANTSALNVNMKEYGKNSYFPLQIAYSTCDIDEISYNADIPRYVGLFNLSDNYSLDFTYYKNPKYNFGESTPHELRLEFYDAVPAIPEFLWEPYKYVQKTSEGTLALDYLIPTYSKRVYSVTYDTFRSVGMTFNHPYTVYAYYYDPTNHNNVWQQLTSFTFSLDDKGFNIIDNHPYVDEDGHYRDPTTGELVEPSYNFTYDIVPPSVYQYDGVPDFKFDIDLSDDISQGAGVVRSLFDRLLDISGLSGFVIVCICISLASWFIFGRRS